MNANYIHVHCTATVLIFSIKQFRSTLLTQFMYSKQLITHMFGTWGDRARSFKLLRNPIIDSKDSIPPAFVAWRARSTTLFLLGSLSPRDCFKIPAQVVYCTLYSQWRFPRGCEKVWGSHRCFCLNKNLLYIYCRSGSGLVNHVKLKIQHKNKHAAHKLHIVCIVN